MSFTISKSRSGYPTATVDGIRLHSDYNPKAEAERFLDTQFSGNQIENAENSIIIIVGAALGYLDDALRKRKSTAKIIAIHLDEKTFTRRYIDKEDSKYTNQTVRWHPNLDDGIEQFLFLNIHETQLSGLRVLEWPAACRLWPDPAREVSEALARVVRRLSGNISATAAFGRLWLRNTFRNFLSLDRLILPFQTHHPIVLAAAGPSLENLLPALAQYRNRYKLWALPSSLAALASVGIQADLVFATDPGHWAKMHYRYQSTNTPIAMPLSAAPIHQDSIATLLLAQNTPGERQLLDRHQWPHLSMPQMGTVAATAINAWHSMSTAPLFLAGLDLCWFDLRSHVRPHSFDSWIFSMSSRTNPLVSIQWERALAHAPNRQARIRTGPALQTYADYLNRHLPQGSIFRLVSKGRYSDVLLTSAPDRDIELLKSLPLIPRKGTTSGGVPAPLTISQRMTLLRELLKGWKQRLTQAKNTTYDLLDSETRSLLFSLDAGGVLELKRSGSKQQEIFNRHVQRAQSALERVGLPQ